MNIVIAPSIKETCEKEILSLFPDASISWLEELDEKERKEALEKADIVLSRNIVGDIRKDEIPLLSRPSIVQTTRTGVDHLDFKKLPESIRLYCNSGGWARGIAESACGMIIALNRCLREQLHDLKQGEFHILGYHQKLLSEQTVLIAGFGGIGQAVAEVLFPFHCRLAAISRRRPKSPLLDKAYTMEELEKAVKEADVLVLALPLTKETEGIISRHILSLMKDDAMIVDVARAHLIEREALLEKVKTCPHFHVAMDVWWEENEAYPRDGDPLLAFPNVIGSAHNAEMSRTAHREALMNALENIRAFMDGKPVKGKVNREEYRR